MRVLVTGSAGHLGEALARTLQAKKHEVVGLDLLDSPCTTHVGSVSDPDLLLRCTRGIDVVMHTATLHKPHIETHSRRDFIETNVSGTLAVLEAALANRVSSVIFTSTTSVYGMAMRPTDQAPAIRVTESLQPVPKNIYGASKMAAEELCALFQRTKGLPLIVLRTSRFFLEADDRPDLRFEYDDLNLKVNEFLYRRLDIADAVDAHLCAAERAVDIGFGRYVVSATTPFQAEHYAVLRTDTPVVVRELFPDYPEEYQRRGWKMLAGIERVYDNQRAREELGWRPRLDFRTALDRLQND